MKFKIRTIQDWIVLTLKKCVEGIIKVIVKRIGITAILFLSGPLIIIGSVSAETYNYAGTDGNWQGQLTLTVNDDGSMLLNGASVVGGTIEEKNQPEAGTFGFPVGDFVSQQWLMSGSQGYAGAGAVDANGNSAGTQVTFTDGNDVIVKQNAGFNVPFRSTGPLGAYNEVRFNAVVADQHIKAGSDNTGYEDSYFRVIFASTSSHNTDGTSAGVTAQATSTVTEPGSGAKFNVWQDAETVTFAPVDYAGTFGRTPFISYTEAYQDGAIKNAASANIQGYAVTPELFTSGSISVVDGDLKFKDGMQALAVQESGLRGFGVGGTDSLSLAIVQAHDVKVIGQSGGSNVASTYANGDSASVTTSFLMTEGNTNAFTAYYPN